MPMVPDNTPKPRGWQGTSNKFGVKGQQYGKKTRVTVVSDTYDYPGTETEPADDYGED